MIIKSLDLIEKKKEEFIPKEEKDATYAKKISKLETKINWNETAKKIVAKINALYPNPGTWFEIDGLRIKPIKVREVKINGKPGSIINKDFTIALEFDGTVYKVVSAVVVKLVFSFLYIFAIILILTK